MKKSELFFSALRIPMDYVMIVTAGLIVYFLRTADFLAEFIALEFRVGLRSYLELILVAAVVFIAVYALDGLYFIKATRTILGEVYRVFRATAIAITLIIISIFLDKDLFSSRFIIILGGFWIVFFVSLGRIILGKIQQYYLVKKEIGVHRLLLLGVNGFCSTLKREVLKNKRLGYKIIGHIDDIDLERIERIRKIKGIDEIIKCSLDLDKNKLISLKDYCLRNRIGFKYVPTMLQTTNFEVDIFMGEPLIEIKNTPLDGWGKITKRVFDIVGALVGIIVFGIPMLLTALAVWIESGRPVIFRNERVGHKGAFDLFKFRYMKIKYCHGKQFSEKHNEKALKFLQELITKQSIKKGPLYKIKDDPRKTKVGAFIEKYSLDEFPQFFNVLKGEMSLVGPRPHQPLEVEKYGDYHRRVLTVKPGVTGLAQVSGRSDLDFEDEVKLDVYYIENWSLWKDIKIILLTIPALLKMRRN